MSKLSQALFIFTLLGAAANASATTFICSGFYGKEVLILQNDAYRLTGSMRPYQDDPGGAFDCFGKHTKDAQGHVYYSTNPGKQCGYDYFRTDGDLVSKSSGMITLVRAGGGDTHDYSGYVYKAFTCVKQ